MNIAGFIVASFLIIILPGQDFMYLVSQSISVSRKAGIYTALGLASGNIVLVSATAFGLTPFMLHNPLIMSCIKIAGFIYLMYLAYKSFTEKVISQEIIDTGKDNLKKYISGITMNVLNVKAWLFMIIFLPQFLNPHSSSPKLDIAVLGIIFMTLVVFIFGSVAIIASKFSIYFTNNKNKSYLKYIRGTIMLVIAFMILIN